MKVIQMRFFQNNRISLYKIKKSRLNRDHFTIGAVNVIWSNPIHYIIPLIWKW